MDQNRDWKLIAALILGGLALLVALGGTRGYSNQQAAAVPQPIIIAPVAPQGGTSGTTIPPVAVPQAPGVQSGGAHMWGGPGGWRGGGHMFPFFPLIPLLFVGGFIFLVARMFGRRRHGWGGPGWYGGPWSGPGPGPQGPPYGPPQGQAYQQYPPQYPPQYGQGQGQPPQQGQQYQQGQPYPQAQQYPQGQPSQDTDAHGDITRPEGSGQ